MLTRRNLLFRGAAMSVTLATPRIVRAATNTPLISANFRSDSIWGDPADGTGLMTFGGTPFARQPNAGNGFSLPKHALIASVSITHNIMNGGSGSETAFIGHWSQGKPTTDMISEEIVGSTSRTVHYDIGQQPEWFNGDYFDCHVQANLPGNWHYVDFNVCFVPVGDN